jgi:hypothetical protein
VTVTHDYSNRLRSYELLAKAFGLEAASETAGATATSS